MARGMKYRIREVDYPHKGYFAEIKVFRLWWPLHIASRSTEEECQDIIDRHRKAA